MKETYNAATKDPGEPSDMDKLPVGKLLLWSKPVSGISSRGAFFTGPLCEVEARFPACSRGAHATQHMKTVSSEARADTNCNLENT